MKNMKISSKAVLKRIQDERKASRRGPVSISVNLALWERFKAACDRHGEPASTIIETMMVAFIEDAQ